MKVMNFRLKVGELQSRTDVSEADKNRLNEIGEHLQKLLALVIEANDQQPGPSEVIEHFIASYDRMSEELNNANQLLTDILAVKSN